jgi:hypothetical protein
VDLGVEPQEVVGFRRDHVLPGPPGADDDVGVDEVGRPTGRQDPF